MSVEAVVTFNGSPVATQEASAPVRYKRWSDIRPIHREWLSLPVPEPKLWSPKEPNLYDLVLRVKVNGVVQDVVTTYFGMRKVHSEDGQVFLNNAPCYQKLILDQGYWPDGGLTAPSDEEFDLKWQAFLTRRDEMGYGLVRDFRQAQYEERLAKLN
jgi:hypothetical protein